MESPEILTLLDVSKILGLSPEKISTAMRQGNLPIGVVVDACPGTKERQRTIIIKKRLERWLNGEDLITCRARI